MSDEEIECLLIITNERAAVQRQQKQPPVVTDHCECLFRTASVQGGGWPSNDHRDVRDRTWPLLLHGGVRMSPVARRLLHV
jgi:hypothetical protein